MKPDKLRAARPIRTEVRFSGDLTLRYTLYRSGPRNRSVYSIAVTLSADRGADHAAAFDVSRDAYRAAMLFDAVVEGTVTPCTLGDVLEDLL